ncbi:MAG: S9 family peptidase [Betaproteobacteria bacterium]
MRRVLLFTMTAVVALMVGSVLRAAPAGAPTIAEFLSPAYPLQMVAARKADRISWLAYERGRRNVYTAAPPAFAPVQLTHFADDNGVDISDLEISDDGAIAVFVRGSQPNREGWVADPTSDPTGEERTIWAVRTSGGPAWKLGEGTAPALSPDGRTVLYAKDGQIYRHDVSTGSRGRGLHPVAVRGRDRAPFIRVWGSNGAITWAPDGTKFAFVSDRVDHSFIGVFDMKTHALRYLSPSVDHDTSPTWSPDSRRIAFVRKPGTPFALQAQQGTGSLGNPDGPAYNPLEYIRRLGHEGGPPVVFGRGGRGGRGGPGGEQGDAKAIPGLTTAAFAGGYTVSFRVADAATGEAHEFWHNAPGDKGFAGVNAIEWAGADHVIFRAEPGEWVRVYSVPVAGGQGEPTLLTPGEGAVEHTALSADGTTLFYTTNAGDIDRRHLWRVPTAGGPAEQLTKGEAIETYPSALASGADIAVFSATATRPQSVGIVPSKGGPATIVFPTLAGFPITAEVTPQAVITHAADGLEIHNQLFLPKGIKPGERRPAVVFVHGGPIRQMLLGYHYMHFYAIAYAVNQWLASQGYVVMSINYRSGIGYGKSFRMARNTAGRGNAEYQDVVAGGKYLQSRPDVDPDRIGIWGLSYGGVLTSQALARNSDIFKAGVDLAGVHLWGSSLDPDAMSYRSSTISAIDGWTSPVLLIHGDDDRNVQFSQTTGLVQLLRAHHVPYQLIVYPDDTHETLLHRRWINSFNGLSGFLGRYLRNQAGSTTSRGGPGR